MELASVDVLIYANLLKQKEIKKNEPAHPAHSFTYDALSHSFL